MFGICSPWILCAQLFLGGEQLNAVLQLEKSLLLRFVVHALVLVKVLRSVQIQKTVRKHPEQHKRGLTLEGILHDTVLENLIVALPRQQSHQSISF